MPEVYNITTPHGVYKVKKPSGRGSVRHFNIMKRAFPKNFDESGKPIITDKDKQDEDDSADMWCSMVLPGCIVEFPQDSEITSFDDVPSEDQYTIWAAMYSLITIGVKPKDGEEIPPLFRLEKV
jgi:hypothetical protein